MSEQDRSLLAAADSPDQGESTDLEKLAAARQLTLSFSHPSFFSLRYLIPHSGILGAIQVIEDAVQSVVRDPAAFRLVVLQGPSGSGKSHLIGAYLGWAAELGVERSALRYLQLHDDREETSSYFISEYERLRSAGGVLLVELPDSVGRFNPHIESRLQAGVRCALAYPEEVELRPLVESLLERHHLVLPEGSLEYLLVRLPLNPLSLESIIAAISKNSFATNKSPKRGLIRGVLRERSDL